MNSDIQDNSPAASTAWWVYMVRAANGHLYTGISTDPARRFRQHQRGTGARFFRRSPAVALVWYDRCADHSAALRRELAIKSLSKPRKEQLISGFDSGSSISPSGCSANEAGAKLVQPRSGERP
ncbi:GIY-YIG nuclease family protein [Pseudomonas sp.]|jgi:putative endonuclease|uniref:GIY-YIG nuclease family protein n=1 Tax=Pseudomonas sp. TaxID=306 RepID=UPI00272ADAC1|nr:GIY-YIG nuclease family protein [Pseudomonas sp.]